MLAGEPVRQHEAGEHIERQQRDLIPPDRHQSGDRAGRETRAPGRPLERARDEPQRERQIGQADDLAGMLQARIGGTGERKCHRGHQRPPGVPAAVAKEQDDADTAEKQIGEGHGVECAQADRGIERGKQHMQRREQQRLRIGDLSPAGKHIRRPPRPFAARQRAGEELHLGKELRLRIPRNRHRTRKPRPGRQQEGKREDRERDTERKARGGNVARRRRLVSAGARPRPAIRARRPRRLVAPSGGSLAVRRHVVPQGHPSSALCSLALVRAYAIRRIDGREDVALPGVACPR